MKVRDIIKVIEDDGWYITVTRGSHRQYKHPIKLGRVTIAALKRLVIITLPIPQIYRGASPLEVPVTR